MKTVITNAAKFDLVEIGEFIAMNNPLRAASFLEELLDKCETIAENPFAYRLIPRYERHDIRRCSHCDYLIFYRVSKETVEIIHILHGARDYDVLLFP